MPTTIPESFRQLRRNLEITDIQESTVSTRQTEVRTAVENGLGVLDSFLTGSYARNTMIAPLKEADVDVFIVLAVEYYHRYNNQNGGQAGLLDLLKRTLRKTYTRTPEISRNGQAVTITFTDFQVDVVPGFNRQGGGFLIPDSITQQWISTDPKKHVEISSRANSDHSGDFIPLVKMIKGWNKGNGGYFRSFHTEVLAQQIFENVRISDFPSGVRFFFDKARDLVTKKNPDPAGYGDDVGKYINTQEKVQESVAKFQSAYERALRAEDFARRDRIRDAVDTWRLVFGDYFPAYG